MSEPHVLFQEISDKKNVLRESTEHRPQCQATSAWKRMVITSALSLQSPFLSPTLSLRLAISPEDRRKTVGVCRTIKSTRQKKRPLFSLIALLFLQQILNTIKRMQNYRRMDLPRSHSSSYISAIVGRTQKNRSSLSTVRFSVYG